VLHAPASNTNGFLWEIHVFHQLSYVGLLGIQSAFLHLEISDLHEVFLSKPNSTLTGKECGRCCSSYHRWFSLERYMCFWTQLNRPIRRTQSLTLPWNSLVTGSIPCKNHLKSHREAMCKVLLGVTLMNFFREVHVFRQLCWIGLFGSQRALLHLWNADLQELFLSKTNSTLTMKPYAWWSCF
jgi:hypothetical protein